MNPNTFPTKGNLMLAKNSLKLAKKGYELMDKKRNILIRELMEFRKKILLKADELERKQNINLDIIPNKIDEFLQKDGLNVEEYEVSFRGICANCQNKIWIY